MTQTAFATWVLSVRWVFAKTMPNIPHQYTVKDWGDPEAFDRIVAGIKEHGYLARWRTKPPNYYLEHNGLRYWWIEPVINRCFIGQPVNEVTVLDTGEVR